MSGPNSNTGMSKVVRRESLGSYEVSCTRMDQRLAKGFTAPNVIKMDVEGAESEVLKGAVRIFESVRPLLICEVHDAINEEFVTSWLEGKRYRMRWLDSSPRFPRQLFGWPVERHESEFQI